jgi:hypothetical protein
MLSICLPYPHNVAYVSSLNFKNIWQIKQNKIKIVEQKLNEACFTSVSPEKGDQQLGNCEAE